jgi:hypothetical protein
MINQFSSASRRACPVDLAPASQADLLGLFQDCGHVEEAKPTERGKITKFNWNVPSGYVQIAIENGDFP